MALGWNRPRQGIWGVEPGSDGRPPRIVPVEGGELIVEAGSPEEISALEKAWREKYGLKDSGEVVGYMVCDRCRSAWGDLSTPCPTSGCTGRPSLVKTKPSELKDSGERVVNEAGFTKEPDDGRPDLSWLFEVQGIELVPRELIERVALHYARGAQKYAPDNWRKGTDEGALARFRRSLTRHIFQWFRGETDEDHAAAITFNVWAVEINSSR